MGSSETIIGTGNWEYFNLPLEEVYANATLWKKKLDNIEKPWLCWKVEDNFCILQQKLVKEVGWTPVVGYDPSTAPPTVLPGSVFIDFNENFGFKTMWLHFPLEFVFLFAKKLAFWHADLLLPHGKMAYYARLFESLKDGQIAAVRPCRKIKFVFLPQRDKRYWEVLGCTTASASESQFKNGSGWWRNVAYHVSCPPKEKQRRQKLHWDSGIGIALWAKEYKDKIVEIDMNDIKKGHFNKRRSYEFIENHNTKLEALAELDLKTVAAKLGISDLL